MSSFNVAVWCLLIMIAVVIDVSATENFTEQANTTYNEGNFTANITNSGEEGNYTTNKTFSGNDTSHLPPPQPSHPPDTGKRQDSGHQPYNTGLPLPRQDYTCPIVCHASCHKFGHCFIKDHSGNYSYQFPVKLQETATFFLQSGVLQTLDDHLTCDEGRKLFLYFSYMPPEDRVQFLNATCTESCGEIQDIRPLIPFLHLFKNTTLESIMTQLSHSAKIQVCKQLKYLDCRVQMYYMKQYNIQQYCEKTLFFKSTYLVRKFLVDSYGDLRTWSRSTWQIVAVNYMDIMQHDQEFLHSFPKDLMFEMLTNSTENICEGLEQRVLNVVQHKTKQILRESQDAQVTADALQLLQQCGGNLKDMAKYATDTQILNSFDSTKANVSVRDKAAMRHILKKEMADVSQMNKDDIVKYSSLLMDDKSMLNGLNKTALEEAICQIGSQVTDMSQARKLKSVLVTLDGYNDITTYSKEKLICLKKLLGTLSPREVANIPTAAFGEVIVEGSLHDVKFSCQVARAVLKQYKVYIGREAGDMNSTELLQLPSSVKVCFTARDVDRIASDQLTMGVIDDIKAEFEAQNKEAPKAMIRKLIQKVKGNSDILAALAKTSLGRYIPSSLLRKTIDMGQQIYDQLQSGETLTFKADCKKAKYFYGALTRKIGAPDTDNYNWTTEVFKRLQETNILSGMPLRHLKQIDDTQMYEVAQSFLQSECITGKQKQIILQKFMAVQEVNSTTITTEDIENMDPEILLNQGEEDLRKYGENNVDDICRVMGQIDIQQVSMRKVLKKAEFCTDCINSLSFSNDNVTNCGAMICAIPEDNLDSMDADALTQHAADLAVKCKWNQQKRRKLIQVAKEKGVINPAENMTDVDLMTMKTLIADLPADEFDRIPSDAFVLADTDIVAAFKERAKMERERRNRGFVNYLSKDELLKQKEGTIQVYKKIISIKLSGGRRRKRSTNALTCDDLTLLGTLGLPVLTVQNLNELANSEVQDCLLLLGQVTGWSSEQKGALVTKMNAIYGLPSNWSSDTISTASSIIQGLSSTEMDTLQLDASGISTLGQIAGWNENQTRSAYNSFMTNVKNDTDPSTLSSAEISSLGNFLCGMLDTEIQMINASSYLEAADGIGSLVSCNMITKLQAWAGIAKNVDAYGSNVTAWDESAVSSIGIVIGGLSDSDIVSLTPGQIDSIDSNHITYFPVTTLSYFTAEQLGNFSSNQAVATTTAQRDALSCDQYLSLQTSSETTWNDTRCDTTTVPVSTTIGITTIGGTASSIYMNLLLMLYMIMCIRFL